MICDHKNEDNTYNISTDRWFGIEGFKIGICNVCGQTVKIINNEVIQEGQTCSDVQSIITKMIFSELETKLSKII
jgi:hypothetical protein